MRAEACAAWLRERDRFLLITHYNPDGDTTASAAALCLALRRAGKRAYLFPNEQITEKLLPYAAPLFAPEAYRAACTVSVDVAAERMFPEGFARGVDLAIDHHPTNTHFAAAECIDPARAACGEIVFDIVKALCGDVTKQEADLLYIALSTDCGCFQYANTDAHAFRSAAELLELGADNAALNLVFFRQATPGRLKLEGMIFSGLRFFREGKIAVNIVTLDMLHRAGVTENDLDDLSSLVGRAAGHRVGLTIRENPDGTSKVSARSGPDFDCSALCARFGGGGHKMAAGCNIKLPPEQALEKLLRATEELWA